MPNRPYPTDMTDLEFTQSNHYITFTISGVVQFLGQGQLGTINWTS